MEFVRDKQKIYYQKLGSGTPIIFLHGWGSSHIDFINIAKILKEQYEVYLLDLPGFGNSSEPDVPYNLDDYVNLLKEFIVHYQLENVILVGHSFGGRIIIKYAASNMLNKIILLSAAGIKNKSLRIKFKIWWYKFRKWWFIKIRAIEKLEKLLRNSGSKDYNNARAVMRTTLKNIVNEDLTNKLKKIKCETLILWGKNDQTTRPKDGIKMHRKIKNSAIVWFNHSSHFLYLEEEYKFIQVMKSYLGVI